MKKTLPYILMSLALLLAVSGLSAAAQRTAEAERRLKEVYASALYESLEETQSLCLSLEKLLVSADTAHQMTLLCEISRAADEVRRCLTVLPLSHEAMHSTITYFNSLSDYTAELIAGITQLGKMDAPSLAVLDTHQHACQQLHAQLALANQEMNASGRTASLLSAFSAGSSPADRPLESISEPHNGIRYPSLSTAETVPKGLTGAPVTHEEALAIAQDFVGIHRVRAVFPAPDTSGSIPAYGVTVFTDDVQLNLEITKQGGHILWMMPETASFPQLLDAQTCTERALHFLRERSFTSMEPVGRQLYNGLCVLTFAPLEQGILLYPDVIRVQIRMDTGDIVGFEAHSYLMNHTDRDFPAPALTEESARALLSSQAEAEPGHLCLLPTAEGEQLCWEFPVRYGDAQYRIYLDAHSGSEVEVKKLIPQDDGTITA